MEKYNNIEINTLDEFLVNHKSLSKLCHSPLPTRIKFVKTGISKDQLTAIKKLLHFDYDLLSRILLITNRSIHQKKGNNVFSSSVSDRIMAILELYSFGYEIMGNHAFFHEWMKHPCERLLGSTPLDMITSHSGLLAVRNELTNIQYGHP